MHVFNCIIKFYVEINKTGNNYYFHNLQSTNNDNKINVHWVFCSFIYEAYFTTDVTIFFPPQTDIDTNDIVQIQDNCQTCLCLQDSFKNILN